ncbi:PcfK-like family protein [Carboxylicivirga marina]|uniref:PcfK-like family protein n=1 Tax=Carboxylicivirga marina TaxID=2800988 RepID=A0ABS1HGC7_9BACT|nr:PcfK-like family protein [Carboxylicivirga marina]MBK3516686.1 PcfK-like family protein [Carboxylicivirga marina]
MKATPDFKTVIQNQLQAMAQKDELFAQSLKKENKNINDCITYIVNTVKASGCSGFAPDEVYAMAAHYYDEDNIEVGAKVKCQVVVNHSVELTEEEKAQAKEDARKQAYADEVAMQKEKLTKKATKKAAKTEKKPDGPTQTSIFG